MTQDTNHFAEWVNRQISSESDREFALSTECRAPSLNILKQGVFPTRKDEEWRYTPINKILELSPQVVNKELAIDIAQINALKLAIPDAHHLVFIDGEYSDKFSDGHGDLGGGLCVTPLSKLTPADRLKAESTILHSKLSDDNIFQHIALGLSRSGFFIEVGDKSEVLKPLHLIYVASSNQEPSFTNPVSIIQLGKHSRLVLVEQFASLSGKSIINVPASYVHLDTGAGLDSYKIGIESDLTHHISNVSVMLENSAVFNSHQYLLGSLLSRSNLEVSFQGPGAEANLLGIYLGDEAQHLDVRTYIDHALPHCTSNQHFRGIMNGHSRGVFNGLVLVREHAQKTDAKQANKNLLLSRDARVDTKPQLEIFADDVKCAHGATIGELDEDARFYLQSRGISKADATLILTRAFTAEITQEIEIDVLREYVEDMITSLLNKVILDNV